MATVNDYGMKISQEGFDVKTCDVKDLVMSSSFNLLKTKLVGTTTTTVAHGLAYTPIFFSTVAKASGKYSFIGSDGSWMDETNFNALSGTVRYYIFYQQAV